MLLEKEKQVTHLIYGVPNFLLRLKNYALNEVYNEMSTIFFDEFLRPVCARGAFHKIWREDALS